MCVCVCVCVCVILPISFIYDITNQANTIQRTIRSVSVFPYVVRKCSPVMVIQFII